MSRRRPTEPQPLRSSYRDGHADDEAYRLAFLAWTDKKLPDEFSPDAVPTPRPEAGELLIARAFEDEWTSLAQDIEILERSRQWLEMRKAFMASARLMLLAMDEIGETDISEDIAVTHLEERKAEFEAFFAPGGGAFDDHAQQP